MYNKCGAIARTHRSSTQVYYYEPITRPIRESAVSLASEEV